jgi:hypothetical protein
MLYKLNVTLYTTALYIYLSQVQPILQGQKAYNVIETAALQILTKQGHAILMYY